MVFQRKMAFYIPQFSKSWGMLTREVETLRSVIFGSRKEHTTPAIHLVPHQYAPKKVLDGGCELQYTACLGNPRPNNGGLDSPSHK